MLTAETREELDAVVDNLTANCGVPRRDRENESYLALAARVRPVSATAADHIAYAQEHLGELENRQ